MAELCRKCFIETWRPNAYDIEHIVMSEENDLCEGCVDCVPYVDHIDASDLRRTPTADDFRRVTMYERKFNHAIACPECGAIFEDDDFAYTSETGLCQCCHESIEDIWVKLSGGK